MDCDAVPQASNRNVIEQCSGVSEDVIYVGSVTDTDVPGVTLTALVPILTHWHTQPAVRRDEPSMPLLLILALCQ
jgi:hypothetical protein